MFGKLIVSLLVSYLFSNCLSRNNKNAIFLNSSRAYHSISWKISHFPERYVRTYLLRRIKCQFILIFKTINFVWHKAKRQKIKFRKIMHHQEKLNIIHSVNLFISGTRTHKQKTLSTKQSTMHEYCEECAGSVMVNKLEKKLASEVRILD